MEAGIIIRGICSPEIEKSIAAQLESFKLLLADNLLKTKSGKFYIITYPEKEKK